MSAEYNGERKGLMYVSTFWPIMIAALAGDWFLATSLANNSSQKDNQIELRRDVDVMKEKMADVGAQNRVSITERESLSRRSDKSEDKLTVLSAKLDSEIAIRDAANTEVETQVDSLAQSISLQFSGQQRWNAGVDGALHELGAKFPEAAPGPWYFPNISNRARGK